MVIAMLFYYYDYLLIQNYKKILLIESDLILVKMKDYKFSINGECLKVTYFSKDEIKIEGNIKKIEINYEEFNKN